MTDNDPQSHPYHCRCDYLKYLVQTAQMPGNQISECVPKFIDWLSENEIDHVWSSVYGDNMIIGKYYTGTPISYNPDGLISFPTYISFKHEADLLAFRLRWGIGNCNDDLADKEIYL